jgi:hypothetical protein
LTDVSTDIQDALRAAGYETWLGHAGTASIGFEDDSVMGFVVVFESAHALIGSWSVAESDLLMRYAPNLRRAGEKAWNVYLVLIAINASPPDEMREAKLIEENLERTRKIVHIGVTTRGDVMSALLPLLPIQATPLLEADNSEERFRRRIAAIAPGVEMLVLDDAVEPDQVVQALGRMS